MLRGGRGAAEGVTTCHAVRDVRPADTADAKAKAGLLTCFSYSAILALERDTNSAQLRTCKRWRLHHKTQPDPGLPGQNSAGQRPLLLRGAGARGANLSIPHTL